MTEPLLEIAHLTKRYREGGVFSRATPPALDDVNLTLDGEAPSILSIVGESGSGKTTLARVLLRLIEPTSGRVKFQGRDLFRGPDRWREPELRLALQPIFQNPSEAFSAHRTVDKYLFETALNLGIARTRREAAALIEDLVASIGLEYDRVQGKYLNQLSGGELQRLSVARAMLPRPKLVIADEPVSMLDASLKMKLVNLFLHLKNAFRVSFVYITHDLSTAYYISDAVAIMFRGSIVEYGPSSAVLTAPAHPYTQLLMRSLPHIGSKWEQTAGAPDLDSLKVPLTGCKFAPRCPRASSTCREAAPPSVDLGQGRTALCFHPETEFLSPSAPHPAPASLSL